MPKLQPTRHNYVKAAVALWLTLVAGSVDVIGYLTLYHAFTAHMTGETVHLGRDLLQARWRDALTAGVVVAAFLIGSVIGRAIIEIGSRTRVRSIASATLLIEAALLAAVIPMAGASHKPVLLLLAMLAAAMGTQTATLTRVGALTVHTTFVTGMLNKLAQVLSRCAFLSYDVLRGRPALVERKNAFQQAAFFSGIWILYLAGAVSGAWMKSVWGVHALAPTAAAVVIVVPVDQFVPLSIEEEKDQS